MDNQAVGIDHLDCLARVGETVIAANLGSPQICQDGNVRRACPQFSCKSAVRSTFDSDTLGPYGERDAKGLGGLRKAQVDGLSTMRPARHGAD